jgi:hypothetical protein
MNSKKGRVILGLCFIAGIVSILCVVAMVRSRAMSQEAQKLTLFSEGYEAGHELAGFSGRPMVMVFCDGKDATLRDFLLSCQSDPDLAKLLNESFIGVYVDMSIEPTVAETYGVSKPGLIMIKDIHGPVLGILESEYSCGDLLKRLQEISLYLNVEKSSIYADLLLGAEALDQYNQSHSDQDTEKVVQLFRRFEPGSKALADVETRASILGLNP